MSATTTSVYRVVRRYSDGSYLTLEPDVDLGLPQMGRTTDLMNAWLDDETSGDERYVAFFKNTVPVAVRVSKTVAKFVTKGRSATVTTERVSVV